jgi:hypothetical protein
MEPAAGLANRIRDICGGTSERKKTIRKAFIDRYGQRSDLVHGNPLNSTQRRHVLNARMLAREAAEGMLFFSGGVARAVESKRLPITPDRDDILAAIDRVNAMKSAEFYPVAQVVRDVIQNLPGAGGRRRFAQNRR